MTRLRPLLAVLLAALAAGASAQAPAVTDAPVPAGLEDGVTYDPADASRAWLVLRAPGKQFVYALGGFNDWTASADALMFRDAADPLGTRWWIELNGLEEGTEVPFYYWVDGQIRVADPYTTKVYYPGESGYPPGAQQHAVGVLTPGAAEFDWTDDGFQAPAQEDLVIYELLLRDFVADHSFAALADTLDYLERLGVNAIELMPVSEYDGDESWGYNPAFHLALDKYYGTPDQLKAFVNAAHARGIAVLLDVVYNHATGQSPLIRLDNQGDFGAPNPTNPWANAQTRGPLVFSNDLNHESPLTRSWLDKANRFWVDEYHVDGYRYDFTKGFTQTCGGGPCTDANFSAYNPQRIENLTRMADSLWAEHPNTIVILEHFADTQEERELAAFGRDRGLPGMALWANMNEAYLESAMGFLNDKSGLERAYPPSNGYPIDGQVAYMESHDEQWMLFKVRAFGNAAGDYNTRELPTALDRRRLATVFFLTVPGPKMLWQFGEVGYGGGPGECLKPGEGNGDCQPSDPGRVDNKPIRWDYWQDVAPDPNGTGLSLTRESDGLRAFRQKVYAVTAAVLDLRARYDVFGASATFDARLGGAPDRWIKLSLPTAASGQPTEAVIVGNFGVAETTVTPGFPAAGTWYEYFSDAELAVTDVGAALTLRPGEYRIYTDVDVPSPDGNLGAVADEDGPGDRRPEGLVSVFPNPTASGATVLVSLARPQDLQVEVFDTLGRRVATLAEGAHAEGEHPLRFDTSGLPAGVYVVRHDRQSLRVTVAR